MKNSIEIWKDVLGFEGKYQISNFGKLKSLDRFVIGKLNSQRFQKGKIQKGDIIIKGYLRYTLSISRNNQIRKMAHVLVASAFLPNPENKPQINHKDGNKLNNEVDNLEWVTCKENIQHCWKNGLNKPNYAMKGKCGKLNSQSIPIRVLDYQNNIIGEFESIREASKKCNVPKIVIERFLRGETKKPRKYKYEKVNKSPTVPEPIRQGNELVMF